MRRLSRVGFVAACAGLVLCALGLGAAVVDYTAPPWRWSGAGSGWLLVSGAFCLLGFFVTATGGALSLASFLRSRKQGEPHPNASARRWTAAFGVAALLCIAFSFWLAVSAQSAYQRYVHPLALAEENRLDSLSPDAVARTYIETHSASLEYWLSDANQRSDWRADNVEVELQQSRRGQRAGAGAAEVRRRLGQRHPHLPGDLQDATRQQAVHAHHRGIATLRQRALADLRTSGLRDEAKGLAEIPWLGARRRSPG